MPYIKSYKPKKLRTVVLEWLRWRHERRRLRQQLRVCEEQMKKYEEFAVDMAEDNNQAAYLRAVLDAGN